MQTVKENSKAKKQQEIKCKSENKMADLSSIISLIIVSEHSLNTPIKRQTLTEWIRKQDPSVCCLQESHFKSI